MKKAWVLSYPLSAQQRLWADWADAQADLSLHWAHSHFVCFVMSRLKCLDQHVRPWSMSSLWAKKSFASFTTLELSAKTLIQLYHKNPKISDMRKIYCNHPKSWTRWGFLRVIHPKDAEGITNSVDPDQTVWSGSALFAQTFLSENLGILRYKFPGWFSSLLGAGYLVCCASIFQLFPNLLGTVTVAVITHPDFSDDRVEFFTFYQDERRLKHTHSVTEPSLYK